MNFEVSISSIIDVQGLKFNIRLITKGSRTNEKSKFLTETSSRVKSRLGSEKRKEKKKKSRGGKERVG